MKLNVLTTAISLSALTLIGAAGAQAGDIKYEGDVAARAVCQSIVEDDVQGVRSNLLKATRTDRGIFVSKVDPSLFQCNGQSLDAFAAETNSGKVAAYLSGDNAQQVAAN